MTPFWRVISKQRGASGLWLPLLSAALVDAQRKALKLARTFIAAAPP